MSDYRCKDGMCGADDCTKCRPFDSFGRLRLNTKQDKQNTMRTDKSQRTANLAKRLSPCGIASHLPELLKIERTLHRWSEDECNGHRTRDTDGQTYKHYGTGTSGPFLTVKCRDLETAALKRLKQLSEGRGFQFYYQSDPRGCALYLVPNDVVPEGESIDRYYTSGIAIKV